MVPSPAQVREIAIASHATTDFIVLEPVLGVKIVPKRALFLFSDFGALIGVTVGLHINFMHAAHIGLFLRPLRR